MNRFGSTFKYSINQGSFWASYSSVFAYASVFLLSRGFSNHEIGLTVALGSAASALLQPFVGAFADRSRKCILHRLIIAGSLVMIVLSGHILSVGKIFWFTALLYGLLVAVMQLLTPLTYSLGMFFINRGVPINFGIARGIGSLTYALLSTALGYIIESVSVDAVIWSVIAVYAVLTVSTLTFHFDGISEINFCEQNTSHTKGFLLTHKSFAVLLFGTVLLFVSHNLISNYMFQIVSYHGRGSREMGIAMSIAAVLEIPVLFFFTYINRCISSGILFKISGLFFCVRSLLLLCADGIGMIYGAQFAQMFGYALFTGASVYYVNSVIEEEHRVQGQAYMTFTSAAGSVLGSFLGGWLLDLTSVPGMLGFSTCIAGAGALIILFSAKKGTKL